MVHRCFTQLYLILISLNLIKFHWYRVFYAMVKLNRDLTYDGCISTPFLCWFLSPRIIIYLLFPPNYLAASFSPLFHFIPLHQHIFAFLLLTNTFPSVFLPFTPLFHSSSSRHDEESQKLQGDSFGYVAFSPEKTVGFRGGDPGWFLKLDSCETDTRGKWIILEK